MGFHANNMLSMESQWTPVPTENTNCVLWLTGLTGITKSQLPSQLKKVLFEDHAISAVVLDADDLQQGICQQIGDCGSDVYHNLQGISEVAKLLLDQGLFIIVVGDFTSYECCANQASKLFPTNKFVEVQLGSDHIRAGINSLNTKDGARTNQVDLLLRNKNLSSEQTLALVVEFITANMLI